MKSEWVEAKDLKKGDIVHWDGALSFVLGRIFEIDEKRDGVRTIRVEPPGTNTRTLNPSDKVEVLLP